MGERFDFKYGRGLLAFCIWFPIMVLIFLAVFLTNPFFGPGTLIIMLILFVVIYLVTEKLTDTNGYAVLHENHAAIHLRDKVHTIEYSYLRTVSHHYAYRYWTITLNEDNEIREGEFLHDVFRRSKQVIIKRALGFKKNDPLTAFMEELKENA